MKQTNNNNAANAGCHWRLVRQCYHSVLNHWQSRLVGTRGTRNRKHLLVCGVTLGSAWLMSTSTALAQVEVASDTTNAAAPGGLLEALLFYFVATAIVVSSLGICFSKNIVRMAVWLFISLGSVSLIYFMLAANFLGAIQLIIYAGGTLILLVFGVMLTSKSPWARFDIKPIEWISATGVCAGLFVCLFIILGRAVWNSTQTIIPGATVRDIGRQLMTEYLVPFEVAGVLLFIVMVGAAHLARQEKN